MNTPKRTTGHAANVFYSEPWSAMLAAAADESTAGEILDQLAHKK